MLQRFVASILLASFATGCAAQTMAPDETASKSSPVYVASGGYDDNCEAWGDCTPRKVPERPKTPIPPVRYLVENHGKDWARISFSSNGDALVTLWLRSGGEWYPVRKDDTPRGYHEYEVTGLLGCRRYDYAFTFAGYDSRAETSGSFMTSTDLRLSFTPHPRRLDILLDVPASAISGNLDVRVRPASGGAWITSYGNGTKVGPATHRFIGLQPNTKYTAEVSGCTTLADESITKPAGTGEKKIWESGWLAQDHVNAWGKLTIDEEGNYIYEGHAHEDGDGEHTWSFSMALDEVAGQALYFEQHGVVHGTFSIGSRDDNFYVTGADPYLAAHFYELRNGAARPVFGVKPADFAWVADAVKGLILVVGVYVALPQLVAAATLGFGGGGGSSAEGPKGNLVDGDED
jgi:hypothetical protein